MPLHGLRITTPNLELRVPDEALIDDLVDLAAQGIHDPAVMPFVKAWTDVEPPTFQRNVVQYHWRAQANSSPKEWTLNFVTLREGTVVGTQALSASDFATRRAVETGSWVGRAHQGQGIGKEMRRAVLTFAFDHLGARVAGTAAIDGNEASLAVTRGIGYEPNGWGIVAPRGQPLREDRFVLTRERFDDVGARLSMTVEGLEPCLPLLGL